MDIIANFKDFCQWYLTVYVLGIILLEPLFLKTRIDRISISLGLLIGTFLLPISKVI